MASNQINPINPIKKDARMTMLVQMLAKNTSKSKIQLITVYIVVATIILRTTSACPIAHSASLNIPTPDTIHQRPNTADTMISPPKAAEPAT